MPNPAADVAISVCKEAANAVTFADVFSGATKLVSVAEALKEAYDLVGKNAGTCRGIVDTVISNMPRIAALLLCEQHFEESYLDSAMAYALTSAVQEAEGARLAVYQWIQKGFVAQLAGAKDFERELEERHRLLRHRITDVAFHQIDQIARRTEKMSAQFAEASVKLDAMAAGYEDVKGLVAGMRMVQGMRPGNREAVVAAAKAFTDKEAACKRALVKRMTAKGQALRGHSGSVSSVAWSPSGEFVATASGTRAAIWRASDGVRVRVLEGHSHSVRSVAWFPSGEFVATASDDSTAAIWRAGDGVRVPVLEGHSTWVNSVAWSPSGEFVATASRDMRAAIWRASDGVCVRVLEGHSHSVRSAAWSPSGEFIATASDDSTAAIWRAGDGVRVHTLEGHSDCVSSVAWSPSGEFVATASRDMRAAIWRASDGVRVRVLEGHSGAVLSVAWSPSGEFVATASGDFTAAIWRAGDGVRARVLGGLSRFELAMNGSTPIRYCTWVASVAWSPGGDFVAITASAEQTARIYTVG